MLLMDGSVFDAVRRLRSFHDAPFAAGRFGVVRRKAGGDVGILAPRGIGGPAIAVAIEELAVLGAREFIALGFAGGIARSVSGGSVVVLEMALPEDGVSRTYGAGPGPVPADRALADDVAGRLAKSNIQHIRGISWTTDAVYRETPRRIRAAVDRGACVVEMESAGLFAVASTLGLAAVAVVVVADEISGTTWHPPSDLAAQRQSLIAVAWAVLEL
jgi:uridine phosphorylase